MSKKISLKELLIAENPQEIIKTSSFEQGLSLMDELVQKVESGTLPLEEAMQAYERGLELLKQLRSVLESAEKKLEVLQG
jgi:exodeoxyribonuclease VII small subunit